MIAFERTQNYELVREIMTQPTVYKHISDDGCPKPEEFIPNLHPSIWYVLARVNGELLGLWMFVPQNFVCWEVHTCLLPNARGPKGLSAAVALPRWIWANTPCRRIVTNVPSNNRLALKFARRAGMEMCGVNKRSFVQGKVFYDQVMLGLSAPDGIPFAEVA